MHAAWADMLNWLSRQLVLGACPVVDSLTTHGMWMARVHRTIEPIGRGTFTT